jgi:hypothetical protein
MSNLCEISAPPRFSRRLERLDQEKKNRDQSLCRREERHFNHGNLDVAAITDPGKKVLFLWFREFRIFTFFCFILRKTKCVLGICWGVGGGRLTLRSQKMAWESRHWMIHRSPAEIANNAAQWLVWGNLVTEAECKPENQPEMLQVFKTIIN